MSWKKEKLGDHINILSGFAFDSKLFNESKGTPLVRIRDVGKNFSETYYDGEFDDKYLLSNGDLLVSMDGEFRIAEWKGGEALLNQRVCKIKPANGSIDKRFLLHLLPIELLKIEHKTSFVTVKHLSVKDINSIEVHLPSISTQQKIASILDKADEIRRKDQQLLLKYDELLQSIFYQMFGDPVKNERGWEMKPVIEDCDCIVPGRDKPRSFTGNIPWITTDDLNHLSYTTISKKSIGLSKDEIENVRARLIPKGSVLMTCVGDLGVISIADCEMVVNQQLHTFQVKKNLNNAFLMFALSYQKPYMLKMATSTTVPYMNKTICNSIPIIIPPMELQLKFSEVYHSINVQKSFVAKQASMSESLFQSLLQKAFKGELIN